MAQGQNFSIFYEKIETMGLEFGVVYKMALCPTRRVLAPILETSSSENDDGIGFWRCPRSLQWHVRLRDEGRRPVLSEEAARISSFSPSSFGKG